LNQKPDRSAQQARAEATGEKKPENIFERGRHDDEIETRRKTSRAGLPPQAKPTRGAGPAGGIRGIQAPGASEHDEGRGRRGAFRKPNLETPAEVQEEKFEPVPLQTQPQGLSTQSSTPLTK